MKTFQLRLSDPRWTSGAWVNPCEDAHASPQAANRAHLRGAVFTGGLLHRTAAGLAAHLPAASAALPAWRDCLPGLNGFFALVCETEDRLIAAVDRVRSMPLFHGEHGNAVYVSDDAEWVRRQLGDTRMDPVARDEFQLTGYVTGADTLFPRVKQLQAGELLLVEARRARSRAVGDTQAAQSIDADTGSDTGTIISTGTGTDTSAVRQTSRYYRFLHAEPANCDEPALRRGLEEAAAGCIRRLTDYAAGRQIVIPLSGGYDSRLIATLLRQAGYPDIFTFTYGTRGNREAQYSRAVARALGLPWHFIEYSAAAWRHAWTAAEPGQATEGGRYQAWASGLCSIPHIQDWLAVRMLSRTGRIAADSVFVPGHSGDFVAGSHIPAAAFDHSPIDTGLLVECILRRHYWRSAGKDGPRPHAAVWKNRILDRAEAGRVYLPAELADAFEKWDWQERQAKFICNAVRIYEFFGHDWWMPLWDAEFMSFWEGVPLALRRQRLWYIDYVRERYAAVATSAAGGRMAVPDAGPASAALGNATDAGRPVAALRTLLSRMSPPIRESLKAIRYRLLPRQRERAYMLAHMPPQEIHRLERAGYRGDDLLVQEFLCMTESSRQGRAV
jgi:asparagine synthase (glutamine-hydrolysing)